MKTKISVTDVGTGSHGEWDGTTLRVIQDGGCGMSDILERTRFGLPVAQLTGIVLRKWLRGYAGGRDAARANELCVEVTRGEDSAVERA